jgi:hypothetical protein
MQKGGVLIKEGYNPQTAIIHFIKNSTCKVFSIHSRGGILFKLTLNAGVISPYSATRSNYPNVDIKEIIFKIVFISDDRTIFVLMDKNGDPRTDLTNTTDDEFRNEVSTQIDIFKESLETITISEEINICYLEPICPSIVYTEINTHAAEILGMLGMLLGSTRDDNTKYILDYIIANRGAFSIGFIAMEMMTGFITLYDYIQQQQLAKKGKTQDRKEQYDKNIRMAIHMAMFEIARLFALGYIHGDLNLYNILIHPDYTYFKTQSGTGPLGKGPFGRALLIDFGASFLHGKDTTSNPRDLSSAVENSTTMNSPKFANMTHPLVKDDRGFAFWWPGYQWLKDCNGTLLHDLYVHREMTKEVFYKHVMKAQVVMQTESLYENPFQVQAVEMGGEDDDDSMLGGKNSSLILHQLHTTLPLHTKELDTTELHTKELDTTLPLHTKELDTTLPLHTKELDTTSSTENIFAKLDPEHKLNVEFITDYVKKEKALQQEILESIQQKKGGKKRNKKSKTRKSKTRKSKTRKSKTKRIYK